MLPSLDRLTAMLTLGKPRGGERQVGSMGFTYRLLSRARKSFIVEWDESHAGFWDSAVRSSDALRAALYRSFRCELAVRRGLDAVQLLWDMTQLFDHIGWVEVMELALGTGWDPLLLALGLQAHLGPRVFVADRHWSDWQVLFDSVVAGCGQAPSFSRLVLLNMLTAAHIQHPEVAPSQHIDDLAQTATGKQTGLLKNCPRAR